MVFRLFDEEPKREETAIERWMKNASIDECLSRAKSGMTSQEVEERNGVPALLRHIQDTVADRKDAKRLESSALYLLMNVRSSAAYCRQAVAEFLQENESVLGEESPITIELYRALAICCYVTNAKEGGGKPKAVKNAKIALSRVEKMYGKEHPAFADTENLLDRVSQPVTKSSWVTHYNWVLI